MTVRNILKWPEKRLRNHSVPVDKIDENIIQLSGDLRDTMKASFGMGIAASQVGVPLQLIVIDSKNFGSLDSDPILKDHVVLINPEIKFLSENFINSAESCLSVPSLVAEVDRCREIELKYTNLSGESISKKITGRDSAVIQHEVDHLVGKLFIDRLSQIKKKMVVTKLRKRILKQKNFRKMITMDQESENKKKVQAKRKQLRAKRKAKKKSLKRAR